MLMAAIARGLIELPGACSGKRWVSVLEVVLILKLFHVTNFMLKYLDFS